MQTSFMRKVMSYADTFERGIAKTRFEMSGFQVLTVTTSSKRIQAIQNTIGKMPERSFSANTFLFKAKNDNQAHFPFHTDWQNSKGAAVDLF